MICVYDPECTDFSTNGLGVVTPVSCEVTETLNGEYEVKLEHALDDMNVLVLPEDLIAVGKEAFMNGACQAVIVPEGCTSIGERAFAGCTELIYVRVPAGTQIAEDAFEGCPLVLIDRID